MNNNNKRNLKGCAKPRPTQECFPTMVNGTDPPNVRFSITDLVLSIHFEGLQCIVQAL